VPPFSRRAFLQAVATLVGTAALPLDLAPPLDVVADTVPILASRRWAVVEAVAHMERVAVTMFGNTNQVYVPGPRWLDVTLRGWPGVVPPRVGESVRIDEAFPGWRVQADVTVCGVSYDVAAGTALVTGRVTEDGLRHQALAAVA
jgi:hypothetical protein